VEIACGCLLNASLHRGGDAKKLPTLSTEETAKSIVVHDHCAMEETSTVRNCGGSPHSC